MTESDLFLAFLNDETSDSHLSDDRRLSESERSSPQRGWKTSKSPWCFLGIANMLANSSDGREHSNVRRSQKGRYSSYAPTLIALTDYCKLDSYMIEDQWS